MGDVDYCKFKKRNLSENLNVIENPSITTSKEEGENITRSGSIN